MHDDPKLFYQLIDTAEKLINTPIQYLFLDEVQNVSGWEKFVKSIYDVSKFKKIWITGSNSSLLNSDYAKLLTGRYLSKMIYPLSFHEILLNNKIDNKLLLQQKRPDALRLVDYMLYHGCFPRIYQMMNEDSHLIRELLIVTTHSVAGNVHIWAKNGENLLSKCSCITHTLRFLKNIFAVFIAKSERSGKYKAKGGEQIRNN